MLRLLLRLLLLLLPGCRHLVLLGRVQGLVGIVLGEHRPVQRLHRIQGGLGCNTLLELCLDEWLLKVVGGESMGARMEGEVRGWLTVRGLRGVAVRRRQRRRLQRGAGAILGHHHLGRRPKWVGD